ncbi:MAG: hypothetical protein QNK40_08750 [Desulfobacterales bacterium]|nr:hypothetical protein [Desulfobacterales bacterium]
MYKYLFGLAPSRRPMSTKSTSTLPFWKRPTKLSPYTTKGGSFSRSGINLPKSSIKLNAVFGQSQWLEKEVWV